MTIIATAAIAHRSHALVLAVKPWAGGLEIRPTLLRIAKGLSHGNLEDTPKGQHFPLSPECRTLTVLDLAKMQDTTAYNWFKRLRWRETEGEPYCPKCGTLRCHTMSRNRIKCTEEDLQGGVQRHLCTVFHARTLSFRKTLILPETRVVGIPFQVWWVLLPNAGDTYAGCIRLLCASPGTARAALHEMTYET